MNALIDAGHVDNRFHPPHTSLHISKINGGIAHNVIADKTYFSLDVRTIPMDNPHDIINEFRTHCRAREAELHSIFPEFKIEVVEDHPSVIHLDTNENEDVVQLIKTISGNDQLNTVAYAAEAGQFAQGGFQSVICGPGSIAQAHRANEFIDKEQLQKGLVVLRNLISEMSSEAFK